MRSTSAGGGALPDPMRRTAGRRRRGRADRRRISVTCTQAGEMGEGAGERSLGRQVGRRYVPMTRMRTFASSATRCSSSSSVDSSAQWRSSYNRTCGRICAARCEELPHAVEHVAAFLLRREIGCPVDVAVPLTQRRHQRRDLRRVLAEDLADPFRADLPCRLLQLVDERLVRRRHLHVEARAGEDVQPAAPGLVERLGGQPRLAGAGLAGDEDEPAHPVGDRRDEVEQPRSVRPHDRRTASS